MIRGIAAPAALVRLARVLYTCDEHGRLISVNEDDGPPAPRLWVAWNEHGLVWRVRHDVAPQLATELGEILGQARPGAAMAEPACAAELRALLAPLGEQHAEIEYECPRELGGDAIQLGPENLELLQRWLPSWRYYATIGLPMTAIVLDGAAVAVCACVRRPDDGATAAGCETHPDFRGHGHAAMATAAWARAVRDRGLVPLYGTSWQNLASQRVAAKLGLVPYACSISFA